MNRRSFIRDSVLTGLTVTPVFRQVSRDFGGHDQSITMTFDLVAPADELLFIENDSVSISLFTDGTAVATDKENGQTWIYGPVAFQEEKPIEEELVWVRQERSVAEQYPGRFYGKRAGDSIEWSLLGRENKIMGKFISEYKLENKWIIVSLIEVENRIPVLGFPTPVFSDCLVLPQGAGRLIRNPVNRRIFNPFWSGFNMRWFGGLRGDNGWIAIFEEGFEDGGVMVSELAAFPVWQKSLGTWNYKRTIRYGFTRNGYTGVAKLFRSFAIEKGIFKSLRDKAAENPEINNLIGSRILSFNTAYPQVRKENFENRLLEIPAGKIFNPEVRKKIHFNEIPQLLEEVRKLGLEKALVNIRGWMNGGYDFSHPDIWPPEIICGGEEALQKAISRRKRFLVSLHDNYQDIYPHSPSFPKGIIQRSDGTRMPGGFWAPGQCYIINGKDGLAYAKRNWKKIKNLGITGVFLDTAGATQSYEDHGPENRLTRKEHLRYKYETLKFFRDQNLTTATESGSDYFIPVVDHIENWHERTPGETIPLWSLVFHDAVLNGRYRFNVIESLWGRDFDPSREERYLEEMLWGYTTIFAMPSMEEWPASKQSFLNSRQVDEWFITICDSEMISHEFLSDDYQLEETKFANGHSIVVNFSENKKEIGSSYLGPLSYLIT